MAVPHRRILTDNTGWYKIARQFLKLFKTSHVCFNVDMPKGAYGIISCEKEISGEMNKLYEKQYLESKYAILMPVEYKFCYQITLNKIFQQPIPQKNQYNDMNRVKCVTGELKYFIMKPLTPLI